MNGFFLEHIENNGETVWILTDLASKKVISKGKTASEAIKKMEEAIECSKQS